MTTGKVTGSPVSFTLQQAVTDQVYPDLAELEMKTCSFREDGRNQVLKASDFAFWQHKLYDKPIDNNNQQQNLPVVDHDETPF